MLAEQVVLFPELLAVEPDLIGGACEEHTVTRFEIRRVVGTAPEDPSFKARLATLRDLVTHHAEEEERDLLPRIEAELTEDANERLGGQMLELFEALIAHSRRPHTSSHAPLRTARGGLTAGALPRRVVVDFVREDRRETGRQGDLLSFFSLPPRLPVPIGPAPSGVPSFAHPLQRPPQALFKSTRGALRAKRGARSVDQGPVAGASPGPVGPPCAGPYPWDSP